MIDGKFIETFAAHVARPVVMRVNGREFLCVPDSEGHYSLEDQLAAPAAEPSTVALVTLTGLVDFIKLNRDGIDLEKCVVHVEDQATVSLRSNVTGEFAQRPTFAKASCKHVIGEGFPFGTYLDQERFVVGLMSAFVQDGTTARLLELVSSITDGNVMTSEDDGRAQAITAKRGPTLGRKVDIPNPVTLSPFRTFRELAQPASLFVLRLRGGEPMPSLALHEADGGGWKLEAITKAKAWLVEQLGGVVPVIG
jgi:hypothetical protein